jgi:hypothetical protein
VWLVTSTASDGETDMVKHPSTDGDSNTTVALLETQEEVQNETEGML